MLPNLKEKLRNYGKELYLKVAQFLFESRENLSRRKYYFSNFTDAIKAYLKQGIIVEVGPGFYVPPALSLLQNLSEIEYVAIDGAWDEDDCHQKFYQSGGIREYREEFLLRDRNSYTHLHLIQAPAHSLPLRYGSADAILYFKVLSKLGDALVYNWKELKPSITRMHEKMFEGKLSRMREEDYKRLAIFTYHLLALEEARRIGRKKSKIIIVPAGRSEEEELENELRIYSNLLKNEFEVLEVERPTWTLKNGSEKKEIGHWQDRNNPSRKIFCIKNKSSKSFNGEKLIEWIKKCKLNIRESLLFKSLVEFLFQAGEA
jgi:hypothetical protein